MDEKEILNCIKLATDYHLPLCSLPEDAKSCEEIVLATIEHNSLDNLSFADPKLLNSKKFILKVCKKNPEGFMFASDRLQNDKDLIEKLLNHSSVFFGIISEKYKNDLGIVLKALNNNIYDVIIHIQPQLFLNKESIDLVLDKISKNEKTKWSLNSMQHHLGSKKLLKTIKGADCDYAKIIDESNVEIDVDTISFIEIANRILNYKMENELTSSIEKSNVKKKSLKF